MKKRTLINIMLSRLLPLFFSFLFMSLSAQEFYEDKPIERISIVVDQNTLDPRDADPILSRMKTKQGERFSQLIFDRDLKELSKEYKQVTPSLQSGQNGVLITLSVVPKPLIHQIRFEGNSHFDTHQLQKELDVEPNTIFDRYTFNQAFQKLKEFYVRKGYFEAVLSYREIPVSQNQLDIVIEIQEGSSGHIANVLFQGFTKEEERELRSQMYTKRYIFLMSWLTEQGYYREDAIEQDRVVILNYLQNHGYADAKVTIQRREIPNKDQIAVWVVADKGPLYHFGKIEIVGNTRFSEKKLEKKLLIHTGDPFSADAFRDSAQALKEFYGQKGYIDANVQPELFFDEHEPIANAVFTVEEGRTYKIGLIHVFGNVLTSNNVILRESLLVPGESFDARKLKATQERLEAMGYFRSVNVYAVRTSDDRSMGDEYRDVYIEVEETSTGSFIFSLGFSSLDNVYGSFDLTEQNFRISGLSKAVRGKLSALRGGGEFLHLKATIGKTQRGFSASWMTPYINDTLWRFGVDASHTFSNLQKNVDVVTTGGSIYANYPITSSWTVGIKQRVRYSQDHLTIDALGSSQTALSSVEQQRNLLDQKGLISAASTNLSFTSLDNAIKPHSGIRSYLELEMAGLGGKYEFGKFSYLNACYLPLSKKITAKVRGDFQYIIPYGKTTRQEVPYSERLFLGGENSVRGYKNFLVGPVVYLLNDQGVSEPTETPLGGLTSLLGSLEGSYNVFSALDIFVFFDVGAVSTTGIGVGDFHPTTGFGARLDIGQRFPLMVGWGVPLRKSDRTPNRWEKFFFSMSGQF